MLQLQITGPELGTGGESDSLNAIKTNLCAKVATENSDIIVGLKVRLDQNITDCGRVEHEVFRRALDVANKTNLPLMVHHTHSGIPFDADGGDDTINTVTEDGEDVIDDGARNNLANLFAPGSLRMGDIYTHTFSCFAGGTSGMSMFRAETKTVRDAFNR